MEKVTEDCSMPNDGAPDPPPDPPQDPLEALKAEVAEGEDKLASLETELATELAFAQQSYAAAGMARSNVVQALAEAMSNDERALAYAEAMKAYDEAMKAHQTTKNKAEALRVAVHEERTSLTPKREALSRALVARDTGSHPAAPEVVRVIGDALQGDHNVHLERHETVGPDQVVADEPDHQGPPAGATPVDDDAETTELGDAARQAVAAADRTLLGAPPLAWLKAVAQPPADPPPAPNPGENLGEDKVVEQLYPRAVELVVIRQWASASLLNRHLGCSYPTAIKLVDRLEQGGVVSKAEGSRARQVLVQTIPDHIKAKLAALNPAGPSSPFTTPPPSQVTSVKIGPHDAESSVVFGGAAEVPPGPPVLPAQRGDTILGTVAPAETPVDHAIPSPGLPVRSMRAVRKNRMHQLVFVALGVCLIGLALGIGGGLALIADPGARSATTIVGMPQHGIAATKATPTAKVQKPVAATQPTKAQPAAQVRPATAAPAPAIAPRPLQRYEGPPPNAPCRLSLPPALAQRVACADPLAPDTRCIPCPRGH